MKRMIIFAAGLYLAAAAISEAQTGSLACAQAASGALAPVGKETCTQSLHPFTHEAQIPANADMASIRFAGIRYVRVATEARMIEDRDYCKEVAMGDPGGSQFCPDVTFSGFAPAYEVTYSYVGPPLASDEYANQRFTFSVDFRPDEFDQRQREQVATWKRSEAAEWFEITKSRPMDKVVAIDEANSTFCAGHYVDGNWVHDDASCQDKVQLRGTAQPSDFMTIRVSLNQAVASSENLN